MTSRLAVMALVALSVSVVSACRPRCPVIVSRAGWGARAPKASSTMPAAASYVFIHHTAGPQCFTASSCERRMRIIQNGHMTSKAKGGRGFSDIGYSFLVGGDGKVYTGRGWGIVGAHTYGYNKVGLGICLMGDFTSRTPPQVQLKAAQDLIECGVDRGSIISSYKLRGHRDVGSTPCPGDVLYRIIGGWKNFSPK